MEQVTTIFPRYACQQRLTEWQYRHAVDAMPLLLVEAQWAAHQSVAVIANIPRSKASGVGGQPGIVTSTGTTRSTAPQLA